MKKGDVVVIILALLMSFIPYFYIKGQGKAYVYIMVDGQAYRNIPLTEQKQELTIETPNGYNTIVIENKGVAVTDANCHDHICEEFGIKKQIGDIIVCLPHKVYIEIKERSYE